MGWDGNGAAAELGERGCGAEPAEPVGSVLCRQLGWELLGASGEERSALASLSEGLPSLPFVCTFLLLFFFFLISECFIFQKLSFYINLSARYIHSHCQNLHIKHL